MPRYMIERVFDVKHDQMPAIGSKSRQIIVEEMPEIVWEHSHVMVDDSGGVKTYCVYSAPSEDAVRHHADALGTHRVVAISEIAGDVTPTDFPL